MKICLKPKLSILKNWAKLVFKSFSFDLGNSRKITTDIIFRSKITEFRSKSPKFRSEFIKISFFEFEFSFRSELANFGEISVEISFPANGGIWKKNEKVNPDDCTDAGLHQLGRPAGGQSKAVWTAGSGHPSAELIWSDGGEHVVLNPDGGCRIAANCSTCRWIVPVWCR